MTRRITLSRIVAVANFYDELCNPLNVANEGKIVVFVAEDCAELALDTLKKAPGGEHAALIGRVVPRKRVSCVMRTRFGGERIVEMPYGEDLPRIC